MEYTSKLSKAIQNFWTVRANQLQVQGTISGKKDYGTRGAATGGKHLDGFIHLLAELMRDAGLDDSSIYTKCTALPGYFRPTKEWDLVVVAKGHLLASIEFKAQVGSFGNNYNNRVEEALGSATDLLTAYRQGKFKPSQKPWMGWLMVLEDCPKSTTPVRVSEPHFPVFEEFQNTSYARRYELFCERLVREQLYDASCLLLSNMTEGLQGKYTEANQEIGFTNFVTSLLSKALSFSTLHS